LWFSARVSLIFKKDDDGSNSTVKKLKNSSNKYQHKRVRRKKRMDGRGDSSEKQKTKKE